MTETTEHSTFETWLDLELEGELAEPERGRLAEHLSSCPRCREERNLLLALDAELEAARVSVREGFTEQVMTSLPPAPWEAQRPRAWRLPLAAAAGLLALATLVLGLGGSEGLDALPAAVAAVSDLFATALLAGAGLLAATWKGTGLVVERTLADSTGGFVAFTVLVVSLNLLLYSMLRRRKAAVETADDSESP